MASLSGFYAGGSVTIACTTAAYTAKDNIGGLLTLSLGKGREAGIVQTLNLSDNASQDKQIDVIFFNANPSGTTFTDNGALDIADTDTPKICGIATFTASDYRDFADNSAASINPSIAFRLNGTSVLYFALVDRGAYDAAATSDLGLNIGVMG